jgi:hypothetical protein
MSCLSRFEQAPPLCHVYNQAILLHNCQYRCPLELQHATHCLDHAARTRTRYSLGRRYSFSFAANNVLLGIRMGPSRN